MGGVNPPKDKAFVLLDPALPISLVVVFMVFTSVQLVPFQVSVLLERGGVPPKPTADV